MLFEIMGIVMVLVALGVALICCVIWCGKWLWKTLKPKNLGTVKMRACESIALNMIGRTATDVATGITGIITVYCYSGGPFSHYEPYWKGYKKRFSWLHKREWFSDCALIHRRNVHIVVSHRDNNLKRKVKILTAAVVLMAIIGLVVL